MSTPSAEQISSPYTGGLAVLSPDLLGKWGSNPRLAAPSGAIALSDRPDVFDNFYRDPLHNVSVWRQGMTARIDYFVSSALKILGIDAPGHLNLFLRQSTVGLNDNGHLTNAAGQITPEEIASLYTAYRVPAFHAQHFSEYFIRSLETVLHHLPSETTLLCTAQSFNFCYEAVPRGWTGLHPDKHTQLIVNLSDPGTPYCDLSTVLGPDTPRIQYRTQAGDITAHGSDVQHGFATSPAVLGTKRARFFTSFKILLPQPR